MDHYGTRGVRLYSKHTRVQKRIATGIWQYIEPHLNGIINLSTNGPFVICDYGCNDGEASLPLLAKIIDSLKKKHAQQQVLIIYNDLPDNDFLSLFKLLEDDLGFGSYLKSHQSVFAMAVGKSFYEQCLPTGYLHFGISTTAMHWLSKLPCKMKNSVFTWSSQCSEMEYDCFAKQAQEDWITILSQRATEMVIGSVLVISIPLRLSEKPTHDLLAESIWSSFVHSGIITEKEFENTNFRGILRTAEDALLPFKAVDTGAANGLKLLAFHEVNVNCPFWEELGACEESVALNKYAEDFTKSKKTVLNSTFLRGLDAEKRSTEERQSIVDELFIKMELELAQNPSKYRTDWQTGVFVITKIYTVSSAMG